MKKAVVILLIIIFLFVIGIKFYFFISDDKGSISNTSLSEVQEITSRARSEKDVTLCDSLPTREKFELDQVYPRDNCIFYVAVDTLNVDFCELFTYKNRRSNCLTEIAIAKKDPDICMNIITNTPIEAERDSCLRRVASYALDIQICMWISQDISKASCIEDIAFTQKDVSLCEYINDSSIKQRCIQSISNN